MIAEVPSVEAPPKPSAKDADGVDEAPPKPSAKDADGVDEEPSPGSSADVFKSANWQRLEAALNQLPVFTVGKEGMPLEYKIGEKPIIVFQADVEAAQKELAKVQRELPELEGCDLIQAGLGSAFRVSASGLAMIVPGPAEQQAAGGLELVQTVELPLFACEEMSREGNESLLLFMSYADCVEAVKRELHEETKAPLSIFSLNKVVQQLAQDLQFPFSFVAPSASMKYIETFKGKDAAKYEELEVDFYSRDGCPYCDMAVSMLRTRGVSDLNIKRIDLSMEANEELDRLGGQGVPFFYSKKTGKSLSGWNPQVLTLDWLVGGLGSDSPAKSGLECPE